MSRPIVEVSEGKLEGGICKTANDVQFFTFKGIPYAKPPVGDLRFAAPVPPEPWKVIRDATKNCNISAQFDHKTATVVGDEDCLYLNVYTPNLPTEQTPLLPVMVFFHGGGFLFGDGTDETHTGPDYLIEDNVVLVSLNYRLGILGFLSLDRSDAPGNMGLKDMVQALKWVQQNVDKFGGDPNNVTIFGVSAGGASVEYLMLSSMARGLFHKVIAQSGSSLLHWAHNDNVKQLASMIPMLKNKVIIDENDLLKFLKSLSAKELVTLSMMALASDKQPGGIHFGFVPTVEKPGDWEPFICKNTYNMLLHGDFTKVPYMSGICDREGLLVVSHGAANMEKLTKEKEFTSFLPFKIDDNQKTDLELRLKSIYLDGDKKYNDPDAFAIDFFSDVDFVGGVYIATSLIAKNNSPVYFYEFAYDGNLNSFKKVHNIQYTGASHGDEAGYLIKNDEMKDSLSYTDKLVRDRMVLMWTNFAKYGNPTPKIDHIITTTWEPVTKPGMAYLYIDDKLTMKYEMYPERIKLFKDLYEKYNS